MDVFYKKVLAEQLLLTEEQRVELKQKRTPIYFLGHPVRMLGEVNYGIVLKQGENLVRVMSTQWVVKHPDGAFQVLWPHEFEEYFVKAPDQTLRVEKDPFNQPTKEQATVLL